MYMYGAWAPTREGSGHLPGTLWYSKKYIAHRTHTECPYLVQLVVNFVEDECLVVVSSKTLHNLVNYGKETTARIIIMSSNKIKTGLVFRTKSFTCIKWVNKLS